MYEMESDLFFNQRRNCRIARPILLREPRTYSVRQQTMSRMLLHMRIDCHRVICRASAWKPCQMRCWFVSRWWYLWTLCQGASVPKCSTKPFGSRGFN